MYAIAVSLSAGFGGSFVARRSAMLSVMSRRRTSSSSALALHGGVPVRSNPMPARRLFGSEEKAAAMAVFDESIASGEAFGYNGPHETAYEADFVAMMGGNGYADGVNSGTSAIFACLGALSLAPGSEVIVPAISDPGAAMPAALLNCVPVVADTTDCSYNTGPAEIERVISPRTGAIVVAHLAGEMADIENIMALANNYGIPVIEDCAQAHGAVWKDGRPAGSFGSLAAFSTMSGKHHATGAQGGVVYTKDEALYWEAKRFADRGKPLQPVASISDGSVSAADGSGLASGFIPTGAAGGGNVRMGLNLNSNELSAAIGRVQLRKLPHSVAKRRASAAAVSSRLRDDGAVRLGKQIAGTQGSYWWLRFALDLRRLTCTKDHFVEAVVAEGIPIPAYLASWRHIVAEAPWFQQRNQAPWSLAEYSGDPHQEFSCANAIAVTDAAVNIPLHENFSDQECEDIAEALTKAERAFFR